ncbi:MAG: DNA repair protein RecN [Planctomycetes bacterium]|nr:DNA repair protein RecN [Planctomycetota bacterium]NOG54793.1 DNA repair protein RecN [Planctomycetota bacterium]
MLRELHISNLAVIESACIDLHAGLNVFTGPTGAGKSLLLGAFDILLGRRISTDLLRPGTREGRVTGLFEIHDPEIAHKIANVADLAVEDISDPHEPMLVTRRLSAAGRSSTSINGHPTTASILKRIGSMLIDLHAAGGGGAAASAQHDWIHLLQPANQLDVLDTFANLRSLRQQYGLLYERRRELKGRIEAAQASSRLRAQQLDLCLFQADEIDAVDPCQGEYEELLARHRLLNNLQTLQKDAGLVRAALYESDGSIVERLTGIVSVLRRLAELDEELGEVLAAVESAGAGLQDVAFQLGTYLSRLDHSPVELDEVADRLNALNRLASKYGDRGMDSVFEFRRTLDTEIESLRNVHHESEQAEHELAAIDTELADTASELSKARRAACTTLEPRIVAELHELALPDAEFTIQIDAADEPGPSGGDRIEMMIRLNPGLPLAPLRSVASGGELSRIMLAVKSVLAQSERVSVLVFDEIDAKVGGRLGTVIGSKLRALAQHHQVLCITHLPQIAAYADRHFHISKQTDGKQTTTSVTILEDRDRRVAELAEMMAGKQVSETSRNQAIELLQRAEGSVGDNGSSTNVPEVTVTQRVTKKKKTRPKTAASVSKTDRKKSSSKRASKQKP